MPHQPLAASVSSANNDHRLRPLSDTTMVLEPRYDARVIIGGCLVFGLLAALVYLVCWATGVPALLSLSLLAIISAGGLGWVVGLTLFSLIWSRAVFDRELGTITLSGFRFQNWPVIRIEAVTAVQACGPVDHSDWVTYQLNLAVEPGTGQRDRINLIDNGDRDAITCMGMELAAFLHVPYADDVVQAEAEVGATSDIPKEL